MLQQVFQLIQKVLSKWLNDAQVVEVSPDPCSLPHGDFAQRWSKRKVLLSHLSLQWSGGNKGGESCPIDTRNLLRRHSELPSITRSTQPKDYDVGAE